MPTLDWIGKKAVINHHREVPYHILSCNPELSVGAAGTGNLLVEGDNLLALKSRPLRGDEPAYRRSAHDDRTKFLSWLSQARRARKPDQAEKPYNSPIPAAPPIASS
jgi:hypothetical protein